MVVLLAIANGVDDVDAVAVEFRGEVVDGAADNDEMEVAAEVVGESATGGGDLVADVAKLTAAVVGNREHVGHCATLLAEQRSEIAGGVVGTTLPDGDVGLAFGFVHLRQRERGVDTLDAEVVERLHLEGLR